jgi:hypothetical protein
MEATTFDTIAADWFPKMLDGIWSVLLVIGKLTNDD